MKMPASVLSQWLGMDVQITSQRPLSGGCISEVAAVSITSRSPKPWLHSDAFEPEQIDAELVIKQNEADSVSNFFCEARGLASITESNPLRVPRVFGAGAADGVDGVRRAFLVLEQIRTAPDHLGTASSAGPDFFRFGHQLAQWHQATAIQSQHHGDHTQAIYGWDEDNFLGSARQSNAAHDRWSDFVAAERIGFQTRWAADDDRLSGRLRTDLEQIISQMTSLLDGRAERSSVLHGDLWSGNYLFDSTGSAALIDPAVYRGCPEAEWGMISWFGSCPNSFEQGYQSCLPMTEGWERRAMVYRLYHQLNHLNLYGGGYTAACEATARDILRSG